ncbi:endo-1,4-beta-xylanase [Asticcacaulis tiandongensis]|uniref:endo-1,4-beta-xylanase n=1 Tax=Asticcacaulis tiandongensis TaxID=2565365 RepID=UPI00112AEC31|nr:endo-1,4-beta-xylanase [Asticcacaulis tiandongensis]
MITRRKALVTSLGAALMTACDGAAQGDPAAVKPLKDITPFPLGVCAMTAQLNDPQWKSLVATHFDRLTPEWEMKMEYILQDDGSLKFDAPDRLVSFARQNRQQVIGHNLIWYVQDGPYFQKLKGNRAAFQKAYEAYVTDVVTHFKGLPAWDVVNEPILNDGSALRDCLWREVLGDHYIDIAYRAAHRADPACELILNDYNLEYTPAKRKTFLRLVERLQKENVPVHVLGTQTHISADLPKGAIRTAIQELAATGLKIHVSEVDISLRDATKGLVDFAGYRKKQSALMEEIIDSFLALPKAQQFGVTIWAARDKDNWMNRKTRPLSDEPVLFDDLGGLKPMGQTLVQAVKDRG